MNKPKKTPFHTKKDALKIVLNNLNHLKHYKIYGHITGMKGGVIYVSGLKGLTQIGGVCYIKTPTGKDIYSEVIGFDGEQTMMVSDISDHDISNGLKVFTTKDDIIYPSNQWLGHIINSSGEYYEDGIVKPLPRGENEYKLKNKPPSSAIRRGFGNRLETKSTIFNSVLPVCRGQRVGIFAGSGVGKSSLLSYFAKNIEADIIVIALIGERGREVNEFISKTLDDNIRKKCIIIATSSDESALMKRRGAYMAMSICEYFKDQGNNVVLFFDSLTRFAESQREIGLMAGEPPAMRAFPPSAFGEMMSLCERSGPGTEGEKGDITAFFTVLVQGSDMEEPVADAVRGTLDGHVILDREISQRGLYPSVNISHSISRSLPDCANVKENELIKKAKFTLSEFKEVEPMVRLGIYKKGLSEKADEAVELYPKLEEFFYSSDDKNTDETFSSLEEIFG